MWAIYQKLIRFKPGTTRLGAGRRGQHQAGERHGGGVHAPPRPDVHRRLWRDDGAGREILVRADRPRPEGVPLQGDWANLDQVDVTGELTGRIVMRRPTAYLWTIGLPDGSGCIVSRAAWERRVTRRRWPRSAPAPTAWPASTRSGRWCWSRTRATPGRSSRPGTRITARIVPDPKTAELAYPRRRAGLHRTHPLHHHHHARARRTPRSPSRRGCDFIWLSLNVEKKPLDDTRVRQAIAMALDVNQIVLAGYNGLAPVARALIQPQVLGHWADAPAPKRDVAGAPQAAGRGRRAEPQAEAHAAEHAGVPDHGPGGAGAAEAGRGGPAAGRAGRRHLLVARQGRGRARPRPRADAVQRQAGPELQHAMVHLQPDRRMELVPLERRPNSTR